MDAGTSARAEAFSRRLQAAAASEGVPVQPTAFARWFNRRSGMRPVTAHAVRKWLLGESCPTLPRVMVLAQLLGIDPLWLRFGTGTGQASSADRASADERQLVEALQRLPARDRRLLLAIVAAMLEVEQVAYK